MLLVKKWWGNHLSSAPTDAGASKPKAESSLFSLSRIYNKASLFSSLFNI